MVTKNKAEQNVTVRKKLFSGFVRLAAVFFYIFIMNVSIQAATATITPTRTSTPVISSVWRVNAGGAQYPDNWGNTWTADSNYDSGTGRGVTNTVSNTNDSLLYQSERYGSPFTYSFDVPPGSYQVTLKFAELYWTEAGQRIFDVSINSSQVLAGFDIFAAAGTSYKAESRTFNNISPSSGKINIQFGPVSIDNAQVCAIQINPMPPTPTATRTPCLPTAITPYIRVNEGIWTETSSVIVFLGTSVSLGPRPLAGGSWSWTGPNGFTSNSREITNIPLSYGDKVFTAVYTNPCGAQSSQAFTVTVQEPVIAEALAGCAAGMTIDGNMNEAAWESVGWNQISKLCLGTNPNNVSGQFKLLWDTVNLYAGFVINDAYLNATQVACATYNNSALEIFLDMANDRGTQPFPGSVGDFHLMISYDCLQFCMNATVAMPPSGMQYSSTYDNSGYVMEVKLPWQLLGVAPIIADTYQFDVQVDFNNGTSERVGQLAWNGDANNWKSSANFGDLRLGYCPSPTATITPVPPPLEESYYIFPNPVNPKEAPARFKYHLKNDSEVTIKVFTSNGNPVRTVAEKTLRPAGYNTGDEWDGKNETGKEVTSGIYLCVMEVTDKSTGRHVRLVRKLAVVR